MWSKCYILLCMVLYVALESTDVPTVSTLETTTSVYSTFKILGTKVTTSTSTPETSNNAESIKTSKSNSSYLNFKGLCNCNLHMNACDINCCCDTDCPLEAYSVFDCAAVSKEAEWREHLEKYDYETNLPGCNINDGWLCVFRNNKPKQEKKVVREYDTSLAYKWPNTAKELNAKDAQTVVFNFGQSIKLIDPITKEISTFDFPYAFNDKNCNFMTPIKHIRPMQIDCQISNVEELEKNKQIILEQIFDRKLLSVPQLSENLIESPNLQLYYSNLIIESCQTDLMDKVECTTINSLNNSTTKDEVYTTHIVVKLYHNYTNLLQGYVLFMERDVTTMEANLWQHFEVQFFANESIMVERTVKQLSGPLGYLHSKPIIVARLTDNNTLDYFNDNNAQTNINLFSRDQQLCQHLNKIVDSNTIQYGISIQSHCWLRISNESLIVTSTDARDMNFLKICQNLQFAAWEQLFNLNVTGVHMLWEQLSSLRISRLGNPYNSLNQWVPLQVHNLEFSPILAFYNKPQNSLTCRNMLLTAAYEFKTTRVTEAGVPFQAVIEQAALYMGQLQDLEFSLELEEPIDTKLKVSVMFFDALLQNVAYKLFDKQFIILHFVLTVLVYYNTEKYIFLA